MSALLVPLGEKDQLPFEARHQDETLAEFERFEVESREFNIRCSEELKEMNQNLITNIIERGGVDGWDTVSAEAYPFSRQQTWPTYSDHSPSPLPDRPSTSSKVSAASAQRRITTPSGA